MVQVDVSAKQTITDPSYSIVSRSGRVVQLMMPAKMLDLGAESSTRVHKHAINVTCFQDILAELPVLVKDQ